MMMIIIIYNYIYNLQFSQIERTCVKVNGAPQ